MDVDVTDAPQARWASRADELWKRARRIAEAHPGIDSGGIYHVLRNLERSPEERLRRALSFGRLRADRS